jgi:hypothetical protein
MVLVKGLYGIEIPRNSSSGFDNTGIPGAEFRSVEFHFL